MIPKVDLSDPAREPTDAELEALMSEVRAAAQERHAETKRCALAALRRAIREAASESARLHAPRP